MFVNFTNHSSEKWSAKQLKAAKQYGDIFDIPFPSVSADGDEDYIMELTNKYITEITVLRPTAVLCQGEMSLSYAVVSSLIEKGILVLVACSKREAVESVRGNGCTTKSSMFIFTRFRKYHVPSKCYVVVW